MQRVMLIGLLMSLSGCNIVQSVIKPSSNAVTGSLIVNAEESSPIRYWTFDGHMGKECSGAATSKENSPYSDIDAGAQVLIKDKDGRLLATGKVAKGSTVDLSFYGSCQFPLAVQDVPASDFYTIQVGNRQGATYSQKELEGMDWKVNLMAKTNLIQTNPQMSVTPEEHKQWEVARNLSRKMEQIQLDVANAQEKTEQNYKVARRCIAEQELEKQWHQAMSQDCKAYWKNKKNK